MGGTRRDSAGSKANKRRSATMNHYAVMGIHDFARGSEAKRAYHRLALEWHPDRQVHAPEDRKKEAEDVFKRINEAYAILSDSVRRKEFDLILRNELLGTASGDSKKQTGARDTSKDSSNNHGPKGNSSKGGGTRLILCPQCGAGALAKAGKKGGPSLQCRGCSAFFHEVYCAGCQEWGATKGRRGESTMRCGCGNVFCQSRCPSCWRWNTFSAEVQGGRTRNCGFCGCKFHEAFCPGCSSWGVWEGKKGCRSLSCDCGGLFYEISCRSCGMWGGVKGRHADDNNSLRCGTCGSESHEAFCPICRQWDSYPGSKGESTLTCKSPRCRDRREGETTKFFQVYCEACVCWRSVLGEKDAVGGASIRCEGCKSDLRGTTCPACGNWDQLVRRPHQHQHHHHHHQGFRRKTRFREKQQPRPDGSDFGAADAREKEGGSNLLLARPRSMCTSCGHQPPESPGDDGAPDDDFPSNSNITLARVVHEDADGVAATVTASAGPNVTRAAAVTTPLAEGSNGDRVVRARRIPQGEKTETPPPLETDEGRKLGDLEAPVVALRNRKSSPGAERAEEEEERLTPPPVALHSAPIDGMHANRRSDSHDVGSSRREKPRADDSQAESLASNDTTAVKESNNRHGECQAGRGISSSASSNSTTDGAADGGEGNEQPGYQVVSEPGVPTSTVGGHSEALSPVAPVPTAEGNAVLRAVKPPLRSTLRRRGGRRPFVPRHPSPTTSPSFVGASAAERAEAELADVETCTMSEIEAAKQGGRGAGEDGEAATAAVLLTPTSAEGADVSSPMTPPENHGTSSTAASRRRTESDRPASRYRGTGRRRRQKRLSSRSSSTSPSPPSPSSSKPATIPPATGPPLPGTKNRTISVSDDHPPAPTPNAVDDDDAAAGCRVTFAAVPRESSPPPPPGIRISGRGEMERESGGPGWRSGAKVMVHLAFCSRCQEYQSWRAPLRSAGRRLLKEAVSSGGGRGSPSPRRHCTECGDLYSNVSYYPAR